MLIKNKNPNICGTGVKGLKDDKELTKIVTSRSIVGVEGLLPPGPSWLWSDISRRYTGDTRC